MMTLTDLLLIGGCLLGLLVLGVLFVLACAEARHRWQDEVDRFGKDHDNHGHE